MTIAHVSASLSISCFKYYSKPSEPVLHPLPDFLQFPPLFHPEVWP